MEDDFEIYAEDNLDFAVKKFSTFVSMLGLQSTTSQDRTFPLPTEEYTVELESNDKTTEFATIQESSTQGNLSKMSKFMLIKYTKTEGSTTLIEILKNLHELKEEDAMIILFTEYSSLNEEEIDLIEVFNDHYENFYIEFEDVEKNTVLKAVEHSDTEDDSEDEAISTEFNHGKGLLNEEDLDNDISGFNLCNNVQSLLEIRKKIEDLDFNDPKRIEAIDELCKMAEEEFLGASSSYSK